LAKCPVCRNSSEEGRGTDMRQYNCPRCGPFEISGTAVAMLASRLDENRKGASRLSHAIRRRASTEAWFSIEGSQLDALLAEKLPSTQEQLSNLIEYFANEADDDRFAAIEVSDPEFLAGVVGAMDGDAVDTLLQEAMQSGLLRFEPDEHYSMTSQGWSRFESLRAKEERSMAKTGTKVFIGHGRSNDWRDLKDFLTERLALEYDEFNRESAAGLSTAQRLEDMLGNASFAFLVMTAETKVPKARGRLEWTSFTR
jgi:hypothetical protein